MVSTRTIAHKLQNLKLNQEPTGSSSSSSLFELLDEDSIYQRINQFIGKNQYLLISTINHMWYNIYRNDFPTNKTYYNGLTLELTKYCDKACTTMKERRKLCASAATYGCLPGLQYLYNTECILDHWTYTIAIEKGHLHVFQFAHEIGISWSEAIYNEVIRHGDNSMLQNVHLSMIQYAHENGCPWDEDVCSYAAEYGRFYILQYAHTNGCPWNEETCTAAAAYGRFHILQYAHTNGCPWNAETCTAAAKIGNLPILKYAHENGCPWDEETCIHAANMGSLACLEYAYKNGCPFDRVAVSQMVRAG